MPLPTLLCFAFAFGLAASLASRAELRISPRPALLTRSFLSFVIFAFLVLVPVSAYFYIFHGDWFLLYLVDVRRVPSAIALIGFVLEGGIGALGFLAGAGLVRSQRDGTAGAMLGLSFVLGGLVVVLAKDRLAQVGSFAQYRGGFGLTPYGNGPLLQGTILMAILMVLGLGFLLFRLQLSGRRT